jgi:hypothetical protein
MVPFARSSQCTEFDHMPSPAGMAKGCKAAPTLAENLLDK